MKGRDWYDLVWYLGRHPQLRMSHLEQRMRQSGDWVGEGALDRATLLQRLKDGIAILDVAQARQEVERFVRDKASLEVWSRSFFQQIVDRVVAV